MGRKKQRQAPRQPSRRTGRAGDGQATAGALRVGGHVTGRAVPPARMSARGHSRRLGPPLGWKGWAAEGRGRERRLRMRSGRSCARGRGHVTGEPARQDCRARALRATRLGQVPLRSRVRRGARRAFNNSPWSPSLALEEDAAAFLPSLRRAVMRSVETRRLLRLVSCLSLTATAMPM